MIINFFYLISMKKIKIKRIRFISDVILRYDFLFPLFRINEKLTFWRLRFILEKWLSRKWQTWYFRKLLEPRNTTFEIHDLAFSFSWQKPLNYSWIPKSWIENIAKHVCPNFCSIIGKLFFTPSIVINHFCFKIRPLGLLKNDFLWPHLFVCLVIDL